MEQTTRKPFQLHTLHLRVSFESLALMILSRLHGTTWEHDTGNAESIGSGTHVMPLPRRWMLMVSPETLRYGCLKIEVGRKPGG